MDRRGSVGPVLAQTVHLQVKLYVSFRIEWRSSLGSVMSTYAVTIYAESDLAQLNYDWTLKPTSSSGAIGRKAINCIWGSLMGSFEERGKTMTVLGSHEWFVKAIAGATQMPMGESV